MPMMSDKRPADDSLSVEVISVFGNARHSRVVTGSGAVFETPILAETLALPESIRNEILGRGVLIPHELTPRIPPSAPMGRHPLAGDVVAGKGDDVQDGVGGGVLPGRPLWPSDIRDPFSNAQGPGPSRDDSRREMALAGMVFGFGFEGVYGSQRDMAESVVRVRENISPGELLFFPGITLPPRYAVFAYAGVDVFDVAPIVEASRAGLFMFPERVFSLEKSGLKPWNMCHCPACVKKRKADGATGDKAGGDGEGDVDGGDDHWLLAHNLWTAAYEMLRLRAAIDGGHLRALLSARTGGDPWSSSFLRHVDIDQRESIDMGMPISLKEIPACDISSLEWPEVHTYVERFFSRYVPPASPRYMVLFPCSAKKPYSFSRSHRRFSGVLRDAGVWWDVHRVVVTSPLGVVPMELELYPAAQVYDTSVVGRWSFEEKKRVTEMLGHIFSMKKYEMVFVHMPPEYGFVKEFLSSEGVDFVDTSAGDHVLSSAALGRLRNALREYVSGDGADGGAGSDRRGGVGKNRKNRVLVEEMATRAVFQFGKPGAALVENARVSGRYPDLKIYREEKNEGDENSGDSMVQVATLSQRRGLLSLTLKGGEVMARTGAYYVEIDDFHPHGDIFAVGVVGADNDIRVGDEVVVVHGGDLRAVGIALLPPRYMVELSRGVAVKTRLHVPREK